jgi:hypothetical protein
VRTAIDPRLDEMAGAACFQIEAIEVALRKTLAEGASGWLGIRIVVDAKTLGRMRLVCDLHYLVA